jgi:hypothetical protein
LDARGSSFAHFCGLDMFGWVWQAGGMKKQGSDQAFHDRRYQERKRAEAERKVPAKKKVAKQGGESRVPST